MTKIAMERDGSYSVKNFVSRKPGVECRFTIGMNKIYTVQRSEGVDQKDEEKAREALREYLISIHNS